MFEEVKGLQEKELILLKELKRICEKYNITYYLAYGTLIGAVRHKGFIPWDDDIDVCMNYTDYLRFEQACKKDLKKEFFLQTRDTDSNAGLSYNKLRLNNSTMIVDYMADRDMNHGISIDIYPIYNISDSAIGRKMQNISAAFYMLLEAGQTPKNHGKLMQIISTVVLFFVRGKFRTCLKNFCHSYMAKYEKKKTKCKALLYGNMAVCRMVYPAEIFEKGTELEFESEMFSVPVGYREFLTKEYGDYMKLPPVEEQGVKLEHILKLDTETPYLKYKGTYYCKKQ